MHILGIETSCDETAAAVVKDGRSVLSSIVGSSLDLHKKFGGVIPEIASRIQLETIKEVTQQAINKSGISFKDIKLISVTNFPGLSGSLLVGVIFAKALSYGLKIPVMGVNHIHAHLYPVFFNKIKPKFPFIGLVVSGGHTNLFLVRSFNDIKLIGRTKDDACGEAFDKVAKIIGLSYPGGPLVESMARNGNPCAIKFSFNNIDKDLDFSFSGIKTAVFYALKSQKRPNEHFKNDLCASFQKAVVDLLVDKSFLAMRKFKVRSLVLGGGVIANTYLRNSFIDKTRKSKFKLFLPDMRFTTDNAAMVAGIAYELKKNKRNLVEFDIARN